MIALDIEKNARDQIMHFLAEQGYPRYAAMLQNFDINVTSDLNIIAYVETDRARIVVNKYLYLEQLSVVIRHELMHRWLKHNYRLEQHVGKKAWDSRTAEQHQIGNIAADYEISNRAYTDDDKLQVQRMRVKDRVLQGLVTEVDHPDWVDLSVEEMYDRLIKIQKKDKKILENFLKKCKEDGLLPNDLDSGEEGVPSDIVSIEDIIRGLKIGKSPGSESSEKGSKNVKDYNEAVDDLIDTLEKALDKINNNPDMTEEEKRNLKNDILDKLEKARSQGEKSQASSSSEGSRTDEEISAKLKEFAKNIEKQAAEQSKPTHGSMGGSNSTTNKDLDRDTMDGDFEARVTKIKDLFNDAGELQGILQDNERGKYNSAAEARKRSERITKLTQGYYNSKKYSRKLFLSELDRLIKDQLKREKDSTYKKPSKKRVFGSNIIFSGSQWHEKRKKPKIVVYYDRSGSWQVPWKTRAGDDAISMLQDRYVRRGLIDLKLKYFADRVSDSPTNVGVGNDATQEILNDIQKEHATNVIILTDDNINGGYTDPVTVPGGVFFIFVESQSPELTKYLHGRQRTEVFFIEDESQVE